MKVLIIGLGSIAKKHIKVLQEIDNAVEIFALRSMNTGLQYENVTDIFNVGDLASYNFDFIIISNPTSKHYSTLQIVKDLNLPLFIEKPLFSEIGLKESKLVKLIDDTIITYVACNLRFLHCIQAIKEIIVAKRINEVNVYCGSYLPDWRPNVDFRTVYSANKEMGGGVHIDLIHELDYLYWILGAPIKSVSTFNSKSSLKISSIDYANYLWKYPDFMANIILNYFRKDFKRTLEIVCESETYRVDLMKNQIYLNDNIIFSSDQKLADTYLAQMRFFIQDVMGKGTEFNSINEAYKILNLCLSV